MYRPILAHILFTLMRKLCTLAFIFFLVKHYHVMLIFLIFPVGGP